MFDFSLLRSIWQIGIIRRANWRGCSYADLIYLLLLLLLLLLLSERLLVKFWNLLIEPSHVIGTALIHAALFCRQANTHFQSPVPSFLVIPRKSMLSSLWKCPHAVARGLISSPWALSYKYVFISTKKKKKTHSWFSCRLLEPHGTPPPNEPRNQCQSSTANASMLLLIWLSNKS